MSVTDEQLSAYADGMLDTAEAARVRAIVSADPVLAQRVARMQAAASALRAAFEDVLAEPVPPRLEQILKAPEPERGRVIQFPASRRVEFWAAAAAACFALAFVGGRISAPSNPIVVADGGLQAAGALNHALNTQPSGAPGQVRIALTIPDQSGGYCRVFSLGSDGATSGLACRDGASWSIVAMAGGTGGAATDYAQAAGATPAAILEAADDRRGGDPLDAAAEAEAMRGGWGSH